MESPRQRAVSLWLRTLDKAQLDDIFKDYITYMAATRKPNLPAVSRETALSRVIQQPKRQYRRTLLPARVAIGASVTTFLDSPEGRKAIAGKHQWDTFCRLMWKYPAKTSVPKAHKMFVQRCLQLHSERPFLGTLGPGRREVRNRRTYADRCRVVSTAGRPPLCPPLRDELFQWFVDIRASVAGKLSVLHVKLVAESMATHIVRKAAALGHVAPELPVIDNKWVRRWRLQFGVSLRKPNRRYKVSRAKLLSRLKAMWLNLTRVRQLALLCFSHDLPMVGLDQKGLHYNESGSKATSALALQGEPAIALKENHAQTRARFTVMTAVVSDARLLPRRGGAPPIEILFKGKTARILRDLAAPPSLPLADVSLAFADRGSHRLEHVLAYCLRWLEPWTPERAAANDWRILMLDAYRPHLSEEVWNCAFSQGYLVIAHGGGTTGLTQVNDTDIHQPFSAEYIAREQVELLEKMLRMPANWTPSRSRQDIVTTCVEAWAAVDHQKGIAGHKRCGLTNKLDGSEDLLITREAADFWVELDMSACRDAAVRQVRADFDAGLLRDFAKSAPTLIEPFDADAVFDEGSAAHCDVVHSHCSLLLLPALLESCVGQLLDAGGMLCRGGWLGDYSTPKKFRRTAGYEIDNEDADPPALCDKDSSEDSDLDDDSLASDDVLAASQDVAAGAIVLSAAERAQAEDFEQNMARLREMRTLAEKNKLPRVVQHIQKEEVQLRKRQRLASPGAQQVVSRWLREQAAQNSMDLNRVRKAADVERAAAAEEKRLANIDAAKKKLEAEEQAKRKAAVHEARSQLPLQLDLPDLGQGHPSGGNATHHHNRVLALERVKARAPKLPPDLEAKWPTFVQQLSAHAATQRGRAVGFWWQQAMRDVLALLGGYATLLPGQPLPPSGNPEGLADWMRKQLATLPGARLMI